GGGSGGGGAAAWKAGEGGPAGGGPLVSRRKPGVRPNPASSRSTIEASGLRFIMRLTGVPAGTGPISRGPDSPLTNAVALMPTTPANTARTTNVLRLITSIPRRLIHMASPNQKNAATAAARAGTTQSTG